MISDFTREICRTLCVEKAIDMEIARLGRKAEIMRRRPLTEAERADDEREQAAAGRLVEIAAGEPEPVQPPAPAPRVDPAYAQMVLAGFDDLTRGERRTTKDRKAEVERAARQRL